MSIATTKWLVGEPPASRQQVSVLTEMAGYKIILNDNAFVGVNIKQTRGHDIILMDIQLSGMDRLTAMSTLKQDGKTCDMDVQRSHRRPNCVYLG